jgi:hypothetical protein
MACSLVFAAPTSFYHAGLEHGRTIPLADIRASRLLLCNLISEPHFAGRKSLL